MLATMSDSSPPEPVDAEALRRLAERNEAISVAILGAAVDPIVVIDRRGIIVDANAATTTLFGYPVEDLVGRNVSVLMPEPFHSEHDGYIERYLASGDPRIIGIGREVEARRADGSVFPMSLAVSEVKAADTHLFTGIIHDLTERNRQRDELQSSNELLEQRVTERTAELERSLEEVARSNRDLEQFASVASHDLQAPLRNVRQGLELLDEHLQEVSGEAFDDEARELRSLVVDAVVRMEDLIKGLLEFARLQGESEQVPVDLAEVIADVSRSLTLDLEDAGGRVVVGQLPQVLGSRLQLRQVFQNLMANSVRYRSDDRPLRIDVSATEAGDGMVEISVADNGIGIDPVHHSKVFELFRRAHPGYEGVGLGLAICRRVVERHGGEISLDSATGEGARFHLTLPRA